ncbi:ATP-binding cassette domain-containing protein [Micromonospora sp. RP3T]|uniref:ATP-binding cassette domain-containing protein n=1 Tax=Micromonospora sp. RP3T TaxID=2135446 RepID=UPI003D738FEA
MTGEPSVSYRVRGDRVAWRTSGDETRPGVGRPLLGRRARVSVARALLGDPPMVLLDEPGRSLDAQARALFWAALDRRPESTAVIASHPPEGRPTATAS